MPRKTIAGLEAEIARLGTQLDNALKTVSDLSLEIDRLRAVPPNTYLSYLATGDAELDAVQVTWRTINAIQDPDARERIRAYLDSRFTEQRNDTA